MTTVEQLQHNGTGPAPTAKPAAPKTGGGQGGRHRPPPQDPRRRPARAAPGPGAAGITDPAWFEVPKSKGPKLARQAVKQGAELILIWAGDGMVQRCLDAIAGTEKAGVGVTVGIIPAGTATCWPRTSASPTTWARLSTSP